MELRAALAFAIVQPEMAAAGDEEDIAAVIAQWEKAANSGVAAGLTALYTDDAVLLPPASPMVQGKDDIQAYWQAMADMGVSNMDLETTEITVSGNDAFEVGTFTYKAADTQASGKAIVLWRKGDDGKWRLRRDIWNEDK
jgi:uncharacterized protein (TIGR02246 family)